MKGESLLVVVVASAAWPDHVGVTNCEGCVVVVSRLTPPWFELRIFRLPGKGGYSTRPSGTTSSLIIWVES
jgi:hypothetical protein